MTKAPKVSRWRLASLAVVLVVVGSWTGLHAATDWYFRKSVPAGVKIGPMLWHGAEDSILSGCGVAVFWMTPEESRRVADLRVVALGLSRQGRGYPARNPAGTYRLGDRTASQHIYHAYGPWMPTPIPSSWTEGTWVALQCADSTRAREFTEAAKSEGAFYASSQAGWVLVAPRLNRVLYSYYD